MSVKPGLKHRVKCAIFGGIISGCGSGLTVRFGGAIDGIDVLGGLLIFIFLLHYGYNMNIL